MLLTETDDIAIMREQPEREKGHKREEKDLAARDK